MLQTDAQKTAVRFPYNSYLDDSIVPIFTSRYKKEEKKMRNRDIVPDEEQNTLMTLRDNIRISYFSIGDIANRVVMMSAVKELPVAQQRIFDAVGSFCGKSGRTVRYYAETSAFYTEEVRQQYDILPFTFFVFARSFGAPDCYKILDYAMENTCITQDALRMKFTDEHVEEELGVDSQYSNEYREMPPGVDMSGFKVSVLISSVSTIVDSLETLMDELEIKDTTREDVLCSLSTIRKALPEFVSAVRARSSVNMV